VLSYYLQLHNLNHEKLLIKAVKARLIIMGKGRSFVDFPEIVQFLKNMNYWLSKKDADIYSIVKNHHESILKILPPGWDKRYYNELKLM